MSCTERRGLAISSHRPRQVSEASVAAARAAGFAVGYVAYSDDSGGVVVDAEAAMS